MATIIKAPTPYDLNDATMGRSVFLAGSIEMGKAENWQVKLEKALADQDVVIFNPRRDDWDASWVQSKDNHKFREQVEWELEALEACAVVALYFDPDTKSPISLLELGIFSGEFDETGRAPSMHDCDHCGGGNASKVIVCCPGPEYAPDGTLLREGFWRKGNVDIVCERYAVQQVATLDMLITAVLARLGVE